MEMDREQLKQILEAHRKWRCGENGGERADLSDANLRGADLRGADLSDANLSDANLRGADLRGADLYGVRGNMRHIKAVQADLWPVSYTATHMQIGCQRHEIWEWWGFSDEQICRMDSQALSWWRTWKPILQAIIAASPAEPTFVPADEFLKGTD